LLLQSRGQAIEAQSNPVKPNLHWHLKLTQVPRLLHSFGQVRVSHASPFQPGRHTHLPDLQLPW
jgi:hypothetical protein